MEQKEAKVRQKGRTTPVTSRATLARNMDGKRPCTSPHQPRNWRDWEQRETWWGGGEFFFLWYYLRGSAR